MIVVADSTPLIALSRVDRLRLLRDVFGEVTVPDAVWNELTGHGEPRAGAKEVASATWIVHRSVARTDLVDALTLTLGRGEAEAIVLAQECHADVLLMDEKLGRAAAERLGLRVTGLIGVLIEARRHGLVTDAAALAESIRNQGVWLSDSLIEMLRGV